MQSTTIKVRNNGSIYGFISPASRVSLRHGQTSSIAGIEVPVAYALAHRFGIEGVWMAYPVAFVSLLIFQTAWYRLVWRKQRIERMV